MPHNRFLMSIFEMVTSIARVVNIMSPVVGNHNLQVAYLAYRIGEALGISVDERNELLTAGALHDIGAFSSQEWIDLLEFEDKKPGRHSMAGYLLLRSFKPFSSHIAEIIKYHHVPWKDADTGVSEGETVPMGSHIIHLADRVVVRISKDKPVLGQIEGICEAISQNRNVGRRTVVSK